jgi:hypothetical protein
MCRLRCCDTHRAVIVAMVTMRMVEPAVDEIVNVVAVGDCLMAATRAVVVIRTVAQLALEFVATLGIGFRHSNHMIFDPTALLMAQVTVVNIVDVSVVLNRYVTTSRTVRMRMLRFL